MIAIDQSAIALKQAMDELIDARDAAVQFVQSRVEPLSEVVKESVDAIFFCNAIHYVSDKQAFIAEVAKTLKPGGRVRVQHLLLRRGPAAGVSELLPKVDVQVRRGSSAASTGSSRTPGQRVEARKQLSVDEYRALLESQGFRIVKQEIDLVQVPLEGWVDISQFEDFIVGVMPGVPLDKASAALQRAAAQTYEELGVKYVPRNWLEIVAGPRLVFSQHGPAADLRERRREPSYARRGDSGGGGRLPAAGAHVGDETGPAPGYWRARTATYTSWTPPRTSRASTASRPTRSWPARPGTSCTSSPPRRESFLAIVQARGLGRLRTGAASAIAAKHMAKEDASSAGVLGSGYQSRTQLEAVCRVRPISETLIYSPTEANREAFADEMTDRLGVPVTAVDGPQEVVSGADVLAVITKSETPVLDGAWALPGGPCHGGGRCESLRPRVRRDAAEARRADRGRRPRAGADRVGRADESGVQRTHPLGSGLRELWQVVGEEVAGRRSAEEITLFKSPRDGTLGRRRGEGGLRQGRGNGRRAG